MKLSPFIFFICCLLYNPIRLSAQNDNPLVGLEQWRIHLPYYEGKVVAEGNGIIYCATAYGLFSYNKSDESLERYSRVSGLNDLEISTIRYSAENQLLLIAYQSSNLDLLYDDGSVLNLSDIKRKNIVGGKSINNILFVNQYAYLSCSFGIVVVDLQRKEIKDTYYIGADGSSVNVYQVAYDGTKFYAATERGILWAYANSPALFNYAEWSKLTTMSSLANPDSSFNSVVSFSGNLFAVYNDTLKLIYNGTAWSDFVSFDHFNQSGFDAINNNLILMNAFSVAIYDGSLNRLTVFYDGQYTLAWPRFALRSNDGVYWVADRNNGLVRYENQTFESIKPNGPSGITAYAQDVGPEGIWVASCGMGEGASPCESPRGIYWYNNNYWTSINQQNDPVYNSLWEKSCVHIAVDPADGKHVYVGGRNGGLLEFHIDSTTRIWNQNNSTIQNIIGDPANVWIGGIDYDTDGNLWVLSNLNAQQLSKRSKDGTWKGFNIGAAYSTNYIYNMMVDSYNQKWINARGLGLVVFNENDPDNPNDDSGTLLDNNPGKGGLPSTDIHAIAEDKDQAIWVGSTQGPYVIYNPGNIFSGGNYDAQKILIEQDGYAQYLLETEDIRSIAVDGSNRKWFGTVSSGVYLMSADATRLIKSFSVDNSPLLSNKVESISIDPGTGEVFFGTDKGICSYRGDATTGGEECDNYYVFPNPVRHDYHGPIAVKGLVENASVKITDLSGQVVYQTKANGGTAVWDGKNFQGARAQTGIYMVYVTNEDGSATCITKMAFTN